MTKPDRQGVATLSHSELHFDYLLRLGDDSLILGQRLTEWCGHAPALEIDLSLSNMALDLIGQATLLLDHAGIVEGAGRNADDLAFKRDALRYRNCLLVEQPNGDFARTMVRQWLFCTAQSHLFSELTGSSDTELAAIAAKALKELLYHVELSADWIVRLAKGTDESRRRVLDGLRWHWRFVAELFEFDSLEQELAKTGIAVDRSALRAKFDAAMSDLIEQAQLDQPADHYPVTGGRRGHHSEHIGPLLAIMQFLPRAYPDAKW
jgi:ring-1,2-phenylacetyl-CoA epoxidase subunit PaaC